MARENLKKVLKCIPEILLLIGGFSCLLSELIWTSSISLNFLNGLIVLGIIAILSLLIWKNKYIALYMSMLLGFVSFYFILALLSEFSEFPVGSQEGIKMLLIGGLICGGLLAISIIMPIKYFKMRGI